MASSSSGICIVCKSSDDSQMNVVRDKGVKTLIHMSLEKEKEELHQELIEMTKSGTPAVVHHSCRRRFIDPRKKSESTEQPTQKLRSSMSAVFDWKNFCYLCEKKAELRHKLRNLIREVRTLPLHGTIVDCARKRNDSWGKTVLTRMESCIDLVAAEAVYHSKCMADFRLNETETRKVRGRPNDVGMAEAFEGICDWLEASTDCEFYSVQ